MLKLLSRKSVRERLAPVIVGWLLIGAAVSFVFGDTVVRELGWVVFEHIPSSEFYYRLSGKDGSVAALWMYLWGSFPVVFIVVMATLLSESARFEKYELWVAFIFLILIPPLSLFVLNEGFFLDPGSRQGKVLVQLIGAGWLGSMVYFYFIFGSMLYALSVLSVNLINWLLPR